MPPTQSTHSTTSAPSSLLILSAFSSSISTYVFITELLRTDRLTVRNERLRPRHRGDRVHDRSGLGAQRVIDDGVDRAGENGDATDPEDPLHDFGALLVVDVEQLQQRHLHVRLHHKSSWD